MERFRLERLIRAHLKHGEGSGYQNQRWGQQFMDVFFQDSFLLDIKLNGPTKLTSATLHHCNIVNIPRAVSVCAVLEPRSVLCAVIKSYTFSINPSFHFVLLLIY